MGKGRAYHTATLLPNDQVLVAGGISNAGNEATVERYDPVSNTWTSVASMGTARAYHTATRLPNDLVLVAGGSGPGGARQDTELYDAQSDHWTPGSAMSDARWQHTATRLSSGRVLVAGGFGDVGIRHDAELYDPATLQWTTIPLISSRTDHTASLLPDGQVLLAGGVGGNGPLALAELFDPGSMTFTPTAPMLHARTGHFATSLPDGRVLVAGGTDSGGPLDRVEVYDPAKKTWQPVRLLATPRNEPVGASFSDGSVLVVGGLGVGGLPLATAELFKLFDDSAQCHQAADCQSGFCVDGVCCNTACASPCNACSVHPDLFTGLIEGATIPGTCEPVNGVTCDDGDACTQADVCQGGACHGSSVVCAASNDCRKPGTCDAATGQCSAAQPKDDGATCDDGNLCTALDRCESGVCVGQSPVVCPEPDSCHKPGTCDAATGLCHNPAKDDGADCDSDHDPCTVSDHCSAGVCVTGELRSCDRYACDKSTGDCRIECDSVNDCSPGYVCNRTHACVDPPDTHDLDNSGCALAPHGAPTRSPGPLAAFSMLVLAALGARRRSGAHRGSPHPRPGASAAT
jgi:hypothetical protein